MHAAIVGGGLAGLTCAVALADAGLRVTVVEREPVLGGRARSWVDAASGDTIDLGPHVLHSEYRNMLALLDRLGTRDLVCWQPEPFITLASGDRAVVLKHRRLPPPLSLLPDLARGSGLSVRDLWSNNRAIWRALRFDEADVPALDRVDAAAYLRAAGVSERMIEWFWAFAAAAVLNVPLERCSAAALLRVQSQLIRRRGLHFGFPAAGLSELFAPQAARAIEAGGGRILLGATAVRIEAASVVLENGERIGADQVVAAVPPQALRALGLDAPAVEPSPYVSSYLWFDRKLAPLRFWAQLGAFTCLNTDFHDLSNIRRGWGERPSLVASNIIYSHRAHAMSDAEIVAATHAEIARFLPQAAAARVVHAVVNRIPMAIPCPLPGSETARPAPSATVAGDWTATALPCSMESAVRSGSLAAEAVLRLSRQRAARGRASRTPPTAHPGRRP